MLCGSAINLIYDLTVQNITRSTGVTPLHHATAGNFAEIVKVLLREGADPNAAVNSSGKSAVVDGDNDELCIIIIIIIIIIMKGLLIVCSPGAENIQRSLQILVDDS